MKLSKIIFSLIFIAVTLICSKAFAIDNFIKDLRSTTLESQGLSNGQNKKASLNRAISVESFFLKTSTQSSVTSRIEERNFLDALFLSFFSYKRIRKTCGNLNDNLHLQLVPHALKLIYPHHHFW